MDTAESMSTVDAEEAGTAAPFTAQIWLERLYSNSSSDAGSCGHDVWVCCCGQDFRGGSTLDAALAPAIQGYICTRRGKRRLA